MKSGSKTSPFSAPRTEAACAAKCLLPFTVFLAQLLEGMSSTRCLCERAITEPLLVPGGGEMLRSLTAIPHAAAAWRQDKSFHRISRWLLFLLEAMAGSVPAAWPDLRAGWQKREGRRRDRAPGEVSPHPWGVTPNSRLLPGLLQ